MTQKGAGCPDGQHAQRNRATGQEKRAQIAGVEALADELPRGENNPHTPRLNTCGHFSAPGKRGVAGQYRPVQPMPRQQQLAQGVTITFTICGLRRDFSAWIS